MATAARLFFTDSKSDSDLYYLTRFLAGDPFLFLERDGRRTLFLNDLEVDRGRKQSCVEEVVRLKEFADAVKEKEGSLPTEGWARIGRVIRHIADERGIGHFEVAGTFPAALADVLRGHGLGVRWRPQPFLVARACKSEEEIGWIRGAVRHTEAALRAGIDRIRASEVRGGMLYEGAEPLTSEMVRTTIDRTLMDRNCLGTDTIVAGGEQGVDPHDRGSGPLPANSPILLDVFPRDLESRYNGDMTRTVVRGRASDEVKRMFEAVQAAKSAAESVLQDGADGFDVHAAVKKTFEDSGFETGLRDGRMVGFFHGTGHGLGLDVHEHPRLGDAHDVLRSGHVVTVEPGLYYPGVGGMRIEDDLVVREGGCENLCELEVELEV